MIDYPRHSPSALNLFAACPSMFIMERFKGIKQLVGAPAHRGTAVEAGVAFGLNEPKARLDHCIEIANARYDTLMALSGDKRREQYRGSMGDMIEMALKELRPYGPPTGTQGFVTWQPDGLRLPIVGYYDFMWANEGLIVDLKTTERMPSEIKIAHARQVALYTVSDNMAGAIAYVTPKKSAVYQLENIRQHRQALLNIAKIVENLLAISDDPDFFLKLIAPDLDSFYWSDPAARQLAFEQWAI